MECGCRYVDIFFFQAEDGIRDSSVTGVQTCALPISVEVAADPGAPPDVLGYFWLETNRRPALLPALIENPAISEMLLVEAAAGGRREIVAALLSSPRARSSPMVVQALSTNPELTPEQLSELQGEPLTSSPKNA